MFCCDQPKCPSSKQGGEKCYCDAVPFGLCCPDYSDSFCETYNNNPLGRRPDNWKESIRKSCCSSVNHGPPKPDHNSCCCGNSSGSSKSNSNNGSSKCNGSNGNNGGGNVLNYREVYVGFNENMYAGKNEDPCCKKSSGAESGNKSGGSGSYCCGNNFNKT